MNVVCASDIQGSTVFASGVLSTYELKKSSSAASVGLSAVGSISLPIGQSADSLVKVSEETINDKEFYNRFFAAVDRILGDMRAAAGTDRFRSPNPNPSGTRPRPDGGGAEPAAVQAAPEPGPVQVAPVTTTPASAPVPTAPATTPQPGTGRARADDGARAGCAACGLAGERTRAEPCRTGRAARSLAGARTRCGGPGRAGAGPDTGRPHVRAGHCPDRAGNTGVRAPADGTRRRARADSLARGRPVASIGS